MSGDVNGYELTVTESKGADFPAGPELDETEWYPVVLKRIEKNEGANLKFGPTFNWVFEVQGEDYQIEISGKPVQMQVRGSTSMICSKNPESGKMSKFYEWYSKVMGAEPAAGHKISTKDVIGKSAFAMVKGSKSTKDPDRTFYNVVMVKSVAKAAVKSPATKKTPVAVKNNNPGGIEDPSEITLDDTPPVPVAKKAAKKADVFADVF